MVAKLRRLSGLTEDLASRFEAKPGGTIATDIESVGRVSGKWHERNAPRNVLLPMSLLLLTLKKFLVACCGWWKRFSTASETTTGVSKEILDHLSKEKMTQPDAKSPFPTAKRVLDEFLAGGATIRIQAYL